MTYDEYIQGALRTESTLLPLNQEVEQRGISNRLFHSILGLQTEYTELVEALEKADVINALEEVSDSLWYLAIAYNELQLVPMSIIPVSSFECIKNEFEFEYSKGSNDYVVEYVENKNILLRTNVSELLDYSKKVLFYGKEADLTFIKNKIELINKALFELSYIISDFKDENIVEQIMKVNLAKLKQRYPDKFDGYQAEFRDLDSEREILNKLKQD